MSRMFHVDKQEHTARITFSNPPHNELSIQALLELGDVIDDLCNDKKIVVLIITGDGDKYFSTGAEIIQERLVDPAYVSQITSAFHEVFQKIVEFPVLTIAAINGFALGGGLEMALSCDTRIAEKHAVFALPEARLGLLPTGGGTQNLPWLIGEAWAKRMILCGEHIRVEVAKDIGLVEEVVVKGDAIEAAMRLAKYTAAQSPDAIRSCKQLIHQSRNICLKSGLAKEKVYFSKLLEGSNALEGVNAFVNKREPKWTWF